MIQACEGEYEERGDTILLLNTIHFVVYLQKKHFGSDFCAEIQILGKNRLF